MAGGGSEKEKMIKQAVKKKMLESPRGSAEEGIDSERYKRQISRTWKKGYVGWW